MKGFFEKEGRLTEKERRNLGILDSIRRGKEISRADISKATDLNIVTVSNYVSKYVKNKIVFETGLDISSGGRRPELLQLNPESCYSIGIDLGSPHITNDANIRAILLDVTGAVIAIKTIKKEKESFDNLIQKVLKVTHDLIDGSMINKGNIKGIGIGIWGVLDRYRGMVRYAVEEETIVSYTTLLDQLETSLNIPVIIEHDATLAAFGEKWAGEAAISEAENLIFMCSDSSCGMVIKGELYYGASKSAGELNLSPPRPQRETDSKKCWASYDYGCCLRSRGIDLGIAERAKALLADGANSSSKILGIVSGNIDDIEMAVVIKAAEEGDELAKSIVEEAGDYLGVKIAFIINLFNPEVIVIGRGIEKSGDLLFSAVRKSVRRWAYEESVKIVKILPASLGENSVAIGAAALVAQEFFSKV